MRFQLSWKADFLCLLRWWKFNPFLTNLPFCTSWNLLVFWYFQGVWNGKIGRKWVEAVSVGSFTYENCNISSAYNSISRNQGYMLIHISIHISIHIFTVNHKVLLCPFCLLLLLITIFPCEISEGISFYDSLPVPVLLFICAPLLVWPFALFEESDCNITFTSKINHCVKSVQIRSLFWSVFSRIRTEYGTEYLSVFGHFSRR